MVAYLVTHRGRPLHQSAARRSAHEPVSRFQCCRAAMTMYTPPWQTGRWHTRFGEGLNVRARSVAVQLLHRWRWNALVVLPVLLLAIPGCALLASARYGAVDPLEIDAVRVPSVSTPALEVPVGIEPYIFRPSGERADPVNLIFLHTDAATASAMIERVLGWRPVVASGMMFRQRAGLRPTARQLAAEISPQMRYHIRLQAVAVTDTQTYVLASVHRDDTAACGHVGRAFDEMRDLVARAFADAGHQVERVDLANTTPGLHCDGSRVGGDGLAALIDLSRVPRVEASVRNRILGVH